MDENYSYGLMNYDKLNITDNEDFYNEWHDKEYFINYYSVNSNEVNDLKPVYENQKNDVHPPLYYLLLRGMATFQIDSFSKWSGLILNNIIFVISSILIFMIVKKLGKNENLAILTVLVNALILGTIEMSLYVRMYELLSMFILLLTYVVFLLYEKVSLKNLILLGITLILGCLTQYHFCIFAFVIILVLFGFLLKEKRYKDIFKIIITIVISALSYLIIFPHAIEHIFFSYRGVNSNEMKLLNVFKYFWIVNQRIVPIGVLLLAFAYFILNQKRNKQLLFLILPIVVYFVMIALTTPYQDLRYIMPISGVIIITVLYMIKDYTPILLICLIAILTPKMQLEMTYSKYGEIVNRIEKEPYPIIFVFNNDNNRFLDDLYLFTKTEKAMIVKNYNLDPIKEIDSKSLYVIVAEGAEDTLGEISERTGLENYQMIQGLNAARIYYFSE